MGLPMMTAAATTPPDAARLLHRAQHGVKAGEAAGDALGPYRVAGQHAVALEQQPGDGDARLGGRGRRAELADHERPATLPLRRSEGGDAARPGPGSGPGRGPATGARRPGAAARVGPHGGEGVIGHLSGPHQVPERLQQLRVGHARRGQLTEEARPPLRQEAAQMLVEPAGGRV